MIKITHWDLGASDNLHDDKICANEPFFLNLNMEIHIAENPGCDIFLLGLTNPKSLEKHQIETLDKTLFLYKDFYVQDIVDAIKKYVENLNPASEDEALLMLRKIFRWEFEDNLTYEFGKAITQKL